jgi:2-dehydropantoate 2-reductase
MPKVALIGIGAVGAIYANNLHSLLTKDNFHVIVDSQRKERYLRDGLYLNGKATDFHYVSEQEITSSYDLLIIATKNNHLEKILPLVKSCVGEDTTILSLLNGIDSEEYLGNIVGKEHLLYSFATAIDSTRIHNHIDYSTEGIIFMGEENNSRSERILSIASLFDEAHITYKIPEDIHTEMWAKYMVNVSINTVSAITRANYGNCVDIQSIKDLIIAVQKEVIALAKCEHIEGLDESYIERYQKIFSSLEKTGKTSMLQDIEAKRVSENRWFCITASRLSKKHNLPTPLIDTLGQILEGIDQVHERETL